MKKLVLAAALSVPALSVHAGPIGRACINSDRSVSPALCGCIQQAADRTLRGADQRRAATFFHDPDQAEKVRMSSTDRDNAFWDRYQKFGATAHTMCAN